MKPEIARTAGSHIFLPAASRHAPASVGARRAGDRWERIARHAGSCSFLCAALLLQPMAAFAQLADDAPALKSAPGAPDLLGVATSLVLVIAAIFLIGWLYTRAQGLRGGSVGAIRIVAAQPLGAKERIVVVQVAGKQLVVGVTPSNISTLYTFEGSAVEATAPAIGGAFASRLRAALGSKAP